MILKVKELYTYLKSSQIVYNIFIMKIFIIIFSLCLLGVSCGYGDRDIKEIVDIKDGMDIKDNKDISDAMAKAIQSTSTKQVKKVVDGIASEIKEKSLVHMKIISPDGESVFDLELKDGQNVCNNLETAKKEGKIKSLTIKDTYLKTLGSLYVYEINGHKNNWILSLNNVSSSVGCSQVFPKEGDYVEWKFN